MKPDPGRPTRPLSALGEICAHIRAARMRRNRVIWELFVLTLSLGAQMCYSAVAQASNGSISYAIASLGLALIIVVIRIWEYYLLQAMKGVEVERYLCFYPVIFIVDPKGKRILDKHGSLLKFLNMVFALGHVGSGSLDLIARLVKGYTGFHAVALVIVLGEVILQFASALGYGRIYKVSCKVRGDIIVMCKHEGNATVIPCQCHSCSQGISPLPPTLPPSPSPSPSASSPTQSPHSASSPITPPASPSASTLTPPSLIRNMACRSFRATPTPPPASVQQPGSTMAELGFVVEEGIAFGGAIETAHTAVDAVMDPCVILAISSPPFAAPSQTAGNSDVCGGQSKAIQDGKCTYALSTTTASKVYVNLEIPEAVEFVDSA